MMKQFKNNKELFDYLTNAYRYELEEVHTKVGTQRRLKNKSLEEELKKKIKDEFIVDGLYTELKLGPSYNMTVSPWIQIYSIENKSGTKGRYIRNIL